MKILLLAAALFSALSAAPASPGEKTDLQELFRSLDRVIARSGEYTARRESRIDSLKCALTRDGLSLRERFDLTERLAENYKLLPERLSRFCTSGGSLALAEETGDNDLIMRARSGIALCYSLGGRFYEAEEILSGIRDTVHVSRRTLQSYYVARHRRTANTPDQAGRAPRPFPPARRTIMCQRGGNQRDTESLLRWVYGCHRPQDWSRLRPLRPSLLVSVPSGFPLLRQGRQPQGAARGEGGASRRGTRLVHTFGHGRHPVRRA